MAGILLCAWHANGLANVEIGKRPLDQVAFRFEAEHSGIVQSVVVYVIASLTRPGYSMGTGGNLLATIRGDDGSIAHCPSSFVLDFASKAPGNPAPNPFIEFPFGLATLSEGQIYDLVFSNLDPDPLNNYVSLDTLYNSAAIPQPGDQSKMLATFKSTGNGPWLQQRDMTPIFCLKYTDGFRQGQSYSDALAKSGLITLSSTVQVREMFSVDSDCYISGLNLYAAGQSAIIGTIHDATGAAITPNLSVMPTAIYSWQGRSFANTLLQGGKNYWLLLTGSGAQLYPLVKGQLPSTPNVGNRHMEVSKDGGKTWEKYLNRDLMAYLNVV